MMQDRARVVSAVLIGVGVMLLVTLAVVKIAGPATVGSAATVGSKFQPGVFTPFRTPTGVYQPQSRPQSRPREVATYAQSTPSQGATWSGSEMQSSQDAALMTDLETFQEKGSAAIGRPVPDFSELAKITIFRRGGVGGLTFFIAEQIKQAGMVMESSIGQLAAPTLEAPVSAETKAMVWNEVNHLVQDSYALANQLLAMNHKAIDALSEALLQKAVSGKEFAQIMMDNGVGVLVEDYNILGQVKLVAGDVSQTARSSAAKVAAVGAALMLTASPAFAGDAAAGEKIFNANCAACHAGGQNSVVPDHTLEKAAIEKFLTGGFKESAVVTQVTNGKNAMPAFGGRLSDDDIANVATYVITTSEAGWD